MSAGHVRRGSCQNLHKLKARQVSRQIVNLKMVVNEEMKDVEEVRDSETSKSDSLAPFTLEILKLIKDSHQQHGLRHGDYQRYRGYCSRRIRRLRKVLKLPQGDRRHFKKREVGEIHVNNPKSDDRYLHLPLMLAERNWAYAMQLRQEANTEPRKKFHLIQKLRKACVYALKLEELCKLDRCDARTKLEAQAYVAWMHGTLQFELQSWTQATENLKKAQVIYEKLASALPEEDQHDYKQRVEEISPSLRYCAYNIGDDKAVDLLELRSQGVLDNFETLVAQTKQKTAAVLQEVQWFGVKVPIRIARVELFLKSIANLDDSLNRAENNQAKIKILEDMFIDLRDIISLVRDEARSENKEIQLLLCYLLSIRTDRTVLRNLLLIQQSKRAQDICRLFDIIIQQVTELTQHDQLKENDSAQNHYKFQLDAYRALRAFYMGKAHANFRRWKEAALVFDLAEKNLKNLKTDKFSQVLKEMLEGLSEKAAIEKSVAVANITIEQHEEQSAPLPTKTHKIKKPLIERLDEFREDPQLLTKNPNVVNVPPAMVPVPAKPLFYDLALNYVEMPSLQDKIEPGQNKQGNKQGGGISGLVKGLWGWGKK